MRILVIESRRDVAVPLVNHLEDLRHCVDFAADETLAVHLINNNRFDAIVLAERLAERCGFQALRHLRSLMRKPLPVLMLGAPGAAAPALGDGHGPDDYLAPPYSLDAITGRLGILRRRKGKSGARLQVGELVFDLGVQDVRRQGRVLRVDAALLPMLQALMEASPKRVSFRELGSCLLDEPAPVADARVRVRMRALREALDHPFPLPMIRNRRDGFCILPPDTTMPEDRTPSTRRQATRRAAVGLHAP
ncbi:DNA-binding response regulator [Stenotrophomonas sp. HITSZ_GD]|uniref:response regulator transcription factor n=1 Tax=Stenotrophomonas sp. HITSZ_GD TaxID=3037248 RepID=UPI00240D83EC|nr:DNA-binding response regulator [Stenotrophomonas sp. HITSZ_GD]MDG2526935.1 DNA-binding response regulator [Stenotrophomonas sp. HITSZ_GD]